MQPNNFQGSYPINEKYSKRVAYFSMEYAIHQPLKIYSGGLGFLSGSHMRSAFELQQNMVGIGILWKYGYYDQGRNEDNSLQVQWIEKDYSFLEDINLKFTIKIHDSDVWVKVFYLNPEIFDTAPMFFMTTDIPENDYLSQTITHRLYDSNEATKIAQYILLGIGGATLLDKIGFNPDIYHLNEAHGLPMAFYLLNKYKSVDALREKFVFTTHTPEEAGNEKHDIHLCAEMSYFNGLPIDEVKRITGIQDDSFNLSLVALRLAKKANGVSRLHGEVARNMWGKYGNICPIISITNAQNWKYWGDKQLYSHKENQNILAFDDRKKYIKLRTFEIVGDQTGKIFDPHVLTIVWARRFAGYKRADFLLKNMERFEKLISNTQYPIQIIWAGKPYPKDEGSIQVFNKLVALSKKYPNVAVLTGYELTLSRRLKQAADIWLNNPRVPREASGTSGMTAAMNGAINFSTNDGWIPEFIKHNYNGFVIPQADYNHLSIEAQDDSDYNHLYEILENTILPMYYDRQDEWRNTIFHSMDDVRYAFDSNRMADEYYTELYN
ncbi:alpha-glucan family phosphorylase [Rhizosphaericola mali]|uniref:starch synthase n=1 Tax=Rhizosphaericola mali TaxID=2545455 RepID=A0A5P2FZI6_9BACT|nr:alpha-glucan family phosphorylase [Rhizosphaericola mali]QES87818.1 alpha-glucan family phosphorylase [Rhizosphaericola mali]